MSWVVHNIPPEYDADSRILILGSFPSVKSREATFFYGHPQNRFWKVLAAIFHEQAPQHIEEKKALLHRHHIALWDVIASCEITNSADSTIKNVIPNDIASILKQTNIKTILLNGKTAEKYYKRFIASEIGCQTICLPSTSPANAGVSMAELIEKWSVLFTETS